MAQKTDAIKKIKKTQLKTQQKNKSASQHRIPAILAISPCLTAAKIPPHVRSRDLVCVFVLQACIEIDIFCDEKQEIKLVWPKVNSAA